MPRDVDDVIPLWGRKSKMIFVKCTTENSNIHFRTKIRIASILEVNDVTRESSNLFQSNTVEYEFFIILDR